MNPLQCASKTNLSVKASQLCSQNQNSVQRRQVRGLDVCHQICVAMAQTDGGQPQVTNNLTFAIPWVHTIQTSVLHVSKALLHRHSVFADFHAFLTLTPLALCQAHSNSCQGVSWPCSYIQLRVWSAMPINHAFAAVVFTHCLCGMLTTQNTVYLVCSTVQRFGQHMHSLHAGCCPTNPRSPTQRSQCKICSSLDSSLAIKGSSATHSLQCQPRSHT